MVCYVNLKSPLSSYCQWVNYKIRAIDGEEFFAFVYK
jgi:hypothetical protein